MILIVPCFQHISCITIYKCLIWNYIFYFQHSRINAWNFRIGWNAVFLQCLFFVERRNIFKHLFEHVQMVGWDRGWWWSAAEQLEHQLFPWKVWYYFKLETRICRKCYKHQSEIYTQKIDADLIVAMLIGTWPNNKMTEIDYLYKSKLI